LINLPIGIVAVLGIAATVPREKAHSPRRFNAAGYLLLAVAIGALQLALDRGSVKDWFNSTEIMLEAGIACLCFYLFVTHSLTSEHPFYTPALFRNRNFVLGSLLICIVVTAMFASTALMPLFLQRLQGYSVFEAGLLLAPLGAGMGLMSLLVGKVLHNQQPRYLITAGLLIIATLASDSPPQCTPPRGPEMSA